MDRIDPPGKRKAAGLVLTSHALPKGENRGQATEIKGPEPIERSLGETVGQGVPMVPVNADAPTAAWHFALQALETELCAMRDPREPEVVWLALRHADKPELPPLLLHRLPILLWAHPDEIKPDNHPF